MIVGANRFIGNKQVIRRYIGDTLAWEKEVPPSGRIIPFGIGSGVLNIDGSNLIYEGSPTTAQPGDTILVAAGSYSFSSWPNGALNITGFNLPSGHCKIAFAGDVDFSGNIQFQGVNKGVDLDFGNVSVGFEAGWGDIIVIDESAVGGYERIKIRNIAHNIAPEDTYFIRHKGASVPYNNGAGTISIKDVEISGITLNGGGSFPILIGGEFDAGDNGYCENVHIHHVHFEGPGTTGTRVTVQNCEGFMIHNVTGNNIDVPLDGSTPHCRFIYAKGRGIAYSNSLSGSSGAVVAIEMFSRTAGQVCKAYNNWSYNSARYSAVEIRSNTAFIKSGVTHVCEGEGDFNSFYTTINTGVFGCSAYDLYDNISTIYRLRNSVAVNPQQGGVGKIWNGSTITPPTISDCIVESDNTLTFLGTDMIPTSGSLLIGNGVTVASVETDFYGEVRPNPPSIGACEPQAAPPSEKSFRAVTANAVENTSPYGYYEFLPENYNNQTSVPLLIFFHGSDERGNGNSELNRVLTWGPPKLCNAGTFNENFIMLAPQWLGANDDNYYRPEDVRAFIEYAKTTYKVDASRIYLTGVSAGTWLLMYYLQNYPTNHEVAASVILSGNAYVEYTDPALIAAANSPIWMMSNISDPLVPWSTNSLPNISVINTRNQINAVTPGMVEKLTGFVSNSHTDKWDGIYDSSLIGTASASYDQFDEPIYDWLLSH